MTNHGWQKGQWRAEKSPHSNRKSLLEANKADKMGIHNSWASPPECFNERGLGPDAAASRSLKFLKDDFLSSQVAPSRAEKFPVSSMDANLYKNFSRRSLRDGKNNDRLPSVRPEVRRRSSDAGGCRSSTSRKSVSCEHTPFRLCCSSLSSLTPVRSDHLPDLVSSQQLLEKADLYLGRDRAECAALSNDSRSPFYRQSDKVLLGSHNSRQSNKINRNCSTFSSSDSDLRRKRKSSGYILTSKHTRSMDQNRSNREAEGIHNEYRYLTRKNSLSVITSEDQSCNEVVWRTNPTLRKSAAREAPSGTYLHNRNTNILIKFPYHRRKRCESRALSDRSKASSRSVVWTHLPKLLHKHPIAPHFRVPKFSQSKSASKLSLYDAKHTKSVNGNSGRNANRIHNRVNCGSSQKSLDTKWINNLRGGSPYEENSKPYRVGSTSSRTSRFLDGPLTDDLRSEISSRSLCTTESSSVVVRGHNSVPEPHIVANRKGTPTIVNASGVPAKRLSKIGTDTFGRYDIKRVNSDLGGKSKYSSGSWSGASTNEMLTLDPLTLTTGLNSSRTKARGREDKNVQNIDKYPAIPHTSQVRVENMEDLLPLERRVAVAGTCIETRKPAFSHRIVRNRSRFEDKSQMTRNPKKTKVKKNDQASIELLRSIYLGTPGTRVHHLPLRSKTYLRTSASQLNQGHTCKIKSYLQHCGANTKEGKKENIGKKSRRFQSLIKSEDPFSYLMGLHGFWGETNYY